MKIKRKHCERQRAIPQFPSGSTFRHTTGGMRGSAAPNRATAGIRIRPCENPTHPCKKLTTRQRYASDTPLFCVYVHEENLILTAFYLHLYYILVRALIRYNFRLSSNLSLISKSTSDITTILNSPITLMNAVSATRRGE